MRPSISISSGPVAPAKSSSCKKYMCVPADDAGAFLSYDLICRVRIPVDGSVGAVGLR